MALEKRTTTAPVARAFCSTCTQCDRLAQYVAGSREKYPGYRGLPVPAFGVSAPHLLVVGLAPGLHGANATGRPFTGDHAGLLLYQTLHHYGFASGPQSLRADDELRLLDARITNAVRCAPPQNKPLPAEIRACAAFLADDLLAVKEGGVIIALGRVAHESILNTLGLATRAYGFAHGATHTLPHRLTLIDSYHCSRYNTQTRRLTVEMFQTVFAKAREVLQTHQLAVRQGD